MYYVMFNLLLNSLMNLLNNLALCGNKNNCHKKTIFFLYNTDLELIKIERIFNQSEPLNKNVSINFKQHLNG